MELQREIDSLKIQLSEEQQLRRSYENAVHDLESQIEKYRLQKRISCKSVSYWQTMLNPLICSHCRKICAQNSDLKNEIARLKKELDHSYSILAKTIDEGAQSFYEKETINEEIEELTASLFEEANRMVSYEKRLRAELENSKLLLSKELSEAMQKIESGLKLQVSRLSRSVAFDEHLSPLKKCFSEFDKTKSYHKAILSNVLDKDDK